MKPSQLDEGPIEKVLQQLYSRLQCLTDGSVATYIPELATAQPEWFGLSIAALDGHAYGVGDCELPFTIQSVSKPFVYALVLADQGPMWCMTASVWNVHHHRRRDIFSI